MSDSDLGAPFDWDSPFAFARWAEERDAPPDVLGQILAIDPEDIPAALPPSLQFHYTSFQADRATAWFLRAVDGMRAMQELANLAVAALPDAVERGKLEAAKAEFEAQQAAIEAAARRMSEGRSLGGLRAGELRRGGAEDRAEEIREMATAYLKAGDAPHEIAGKIERRGKGSKPTIYKALESHPAGHWQRKS